MMKTCEDCCGTGYVEVRDRNPDGKPRKRMVPCARCDGVGKRHVCQIPNCVNGGHCLRIVR